MVLVVLAAMTFVLVGGSQAVALNLTGTWNANYRCEAGGCEGADFPTVVVLHQAEGSSEVTGSNGVETITGTVTGNTFIFRSSVSTYEANGVLTIAPDGLSWSGPLSDSLGSSGTYTATRKTSAAIVSGRLVDDRSLRGTPGVNVSLTGTSDEEKAVSQSAVSDAHGEYRFEAPPGNYKVAVNGEPDEQNGGSWSVASEPVAPHSDECNGTPKENTCVLAHLAIGEKAEASFQYTFCTSPERLPNGKPPSGCPVIFIPGFLGSRIVCSTGETWPDLPLADFADMLLEADGATNAGAPGSCDATTTPVSGQAGLVRSAVVDIYGSAIDYLNRIEAFGGSPTPEAGAFAFPYDWRKSPLLTLGALDREVDEVLAKTKAARVVLMAHSMGGLVLRAYIDDAAHANKVARAITLGTPYWGAPKSHTALLSYKSNTPKPELIGLDLFLNGRDLQKSARNMQGLYWLYPDANFGPWLKVNQSGMPSGWLGGSQIDPWISELGGTPALMNRAIAGHAALDGFRTNGVQFEAVVGVGEPTITAMEVSVSPWEPFQQVKVWFGSGDGTVPARSATQGAFEGSAPLGENVPINYVCGVDHVALPGNPGVQSRIEDYLLRGGPLNTTQECPYTGVETEVYEIVTAAATNSRVEQRATVATATGTMTLQQASSLGLIQLVPSGSRTIVVTDNHHPVTLQFSGTRLALKVRSLTSAGKGKGNVKGDGPARFYGPVKGTLIVGAGGRVEHNGKPARPQTGNRPPKTTARVKRHGRHYTVSLSAKSANGLAGTYYRIGTSKPKRYRKPLKLTRAQLKRLSFASVDSFGTWESSRRAAVPR